ncbi:MAG: SDR family NAD(P)-dependent oxidoreductase, partial [Acidimicrobiia bacterium]|nr:SDR family NAD(P)-dependent oxidoreductase [Acidimicrobiia bacterium]NNL26902.1 SDR family NAD(P)-dependent oxidoreductase [Acidimicrobiia bacterium]
MSDNLADRTILVTGASSGIGRQLCRSYADEGASVIGTARRTGELA